MDLKSFPFIELGEQLRKLRGDLSKKIFAKRLGISVQTYYRYETGERQVPAGTLQEAEAIARGEFVSTYKDEVDVSLVSTEALGDLMKMTTAILTSPTEYAGSLAANIRSFYRSLELEKRTAKLENECKDLRQRLAALEDKLKDPPTPEECKKSAAG